MGDVKTKPNKLSTEKFLSTIPDEQKRKDYFELMTLMKSITKKDPVMWGTAIIGFDRYHFKSTRSSQEGDWPLIGFSPRKQNLTLYIQLDAKNNTTLFKKLGKHKTSKACLYINKLSDVDRTILRAIVANAYEEAKRLHSS